MWKQSLKEVDLSQSPIVRWLGPRRARIYYVPWGGLMYALLVVIGGRGLCAVSLIPSDRGTRFIVFASVALIVAAASLLTRMLVRVFAELRSIEEKHK